MLQLPGTKYAEGYTEYRKEETIKSERLFELVRKLALEVDSDAGQ